MEKTINPLDLFPDEISKKIFDSMPKVYLLFSRSVCKSWNEFIGKTSYEIIRNQLVMLLESNDLRCFNFLTKNCTVFPNVIKIFREIVVKMTEKGLVKLLERIFNKFYKFEIFEPVYDKLCYSAALGGHIDILKLLKEKFCRPHKISYFGAIESDRIEVIKWLHENECPWDYRTSAHAALHGKFEILKWLHDKKCPWDLRTSKASVIGGHLEILKWVYENGCDIYSSICADAAKSGQLEILKWAYENGFFIFPYTYSSAADCGHLEILKWLSLNFPNDFVTRIDSICTTSAKKGHLAILKWIKEIYPKYKLNSIVSAHAAFRGHSEIVKWFYENEHHQSNTLTHTLPSESEHIWHENIIVYAATNGNLEMLKWMIAHNCPWNKKVYTKASRFNHLDIVKWAYEKNYSWNEKACMRATKWKSHEIINWMIENKVPGYEICLGKN